MKMYEEVEWVTGDMIMILPSPKQKIFLVSTAGLRAGVDQSV
jgi:hypothetical protein